MKKVILFFLLVFSFTSAYSIPLFPHFVDVAGEFEEGSTEKFVALNIPTIAWRVSPSYFKTLKDADSFLMDTLPFSSYPIEKETKKLADGTEIVIYRSSLEADGLYKDKWAMLYLVQTPNEPLYVGLFEDELN